MNPIKNLPKIIKTPRLELRQLDVTPENAQLIFDAVKDENPDDFVFNPIVDDKVIPTCADDMLRQMQRESEWTADNGANLYIFLDGKPIGYRRIYFFDNATKTLQRANTWLVHSAWGRGFALESYQAIERIAFEELGANRITSQCSTENTRSANSIKRAGFHLDGVARQGGVYPNGRLYDNMMWSKLRSEYAGEK